MPSQSSAETAPPQGRAAPAIDRRTRRRMTPLMSSALIIYVSLAALVVLDPRPLQDWLDDLEPNVVVDAARSCLDRIARFSKAIGTTEVSDFIRGRVKLITRRRDGSS
jgi:hypothetical protein